MLFGPIFMGLGTMLAITEVVDQSVAQDLAAKLGSTGCPSDGAAASASCDHLRELEAAHRILPPLAIGAFVFGGTLVTMSGISFARASIEAKRSALRVTPLGDARSAMLVVNGSW